MTERLVYADNAATTSVSPAVLEAMLPYFGEGYGNPSSLHQKGRAAKAAITEARETIASLLGCKPNELYFTASGSEADNWAIKGAAHGLMNRGKHIISTKIEHHAVLHSLEALEKETFSVIGYPGTDETTKKIYAAYVQRLRDDEGYKIVGVLPNYKGDYEGLINVKNGVILDDGMVIPAEKAVAWVAGASAAAEVWESLTNTAYDDAVGADIKYSKTEYKQAVQNGEFVFYTDTDCARVLTDINCLTTFGLTKTEDWTSNRLVRVLDGWANDVAKAYGETYLGKQNNNPAGRDLFKADVVNLGAQYEAREAITDFKADDVVISQGAGKRDVVAECVIQPVDSMEKLYMTVNVI